MNVDNVKDVSTQKSKDECVILTIKHFLENKRRLSPCYESIEIAQNDDDKEETGTKKEKIS